MPAAQDSKPGAPRRARRRQQRERIARRCAAASTAADAAGGEARAAARALRAPGGEAVTDKAWWGWLISQNLDSSASVIA